MSSTSRAARHAKPASPAPRRGRRAVRVFALLVLFVLGAVLFLYPAVSGASAQRQAQQQVAAALAQDGSQSALAGAEGQAVPAKRSPAGDPAYEFLQSYNARVAAGTAGAVNDPWGIGSDEGELAGVGLADALVGSLSIPSLDVDLPLYLGSTEAHMSEGATVVSGTSAPLGGVGQNCVIAAHRGPWRGLPMFRDIENLREGDTVVLDTPWDTLTYRVAEIRIISPSDVAAVAPQPGRDLVSLVTCHPYGYNYERYLVICERTANAPSVQAGASTLGAAVQKTFTDAVAPSSSALLTLERWLRVAGVALIVLTVAWCVGAAVRGAVRYARRA